MKTLREYINMIEGKEISDEWFKSGGFKTYKFAKPVEYRIADEAGTVDTLEGPVKHGAGFYIMTGPKGEQYPITPDRFRDLYDVDDKGIARPKKIIKWAKVADHSGTVNTSWGEPLNYNPDEDVIVRHGENDYGVVKKDIFQQTYDTSEMENKK